MGISNSFDMYKINNLCANYYWFKIPIIILRIKQTKNK